jgi:hypothetical protein
MTGESPFLHLPLQRPDPGAPDRTRWNRSAAALLFEIDRSTLARKIRTSRLALLYVRSRVECLNCRKSPQDRIDKDNLLKICAREVFHPVFA